ncbi:MAG TPA: M42 family metallopeptidase [Anaerolineaceae bacterium]|nr:M42 family metallopeptidase [Anaerolineaceae bacterium]HNS37404.1 M42 family metallopeptidase [Anaerolineaceae bacterium]HOD04167.1 M42 family metallopeptidase [Anaerolineaceae bacterium]HQF63720.1 M42 family metallopeptidase [Anaerolineaceae bacterium]HQH86767.1 M42 family metallopeptidase [Anaerolineaceae bacterium]
MKELIRKLVEAVGPSGYEGAVRDLVRSEISDSVGELRVDAMGNLIARKGQRQNGGLRIMLSAHMDEIGVMATHIDENGFVRFTTIGGVHPRTCFGGRVQFVNGTRGLIGGERTDAPDKIHSFEQLFIDVGASSRETCPVKVGDIAAFDRPMIDLGDRLVSKAMDDRIACAVLIETLRAIKKSPHELFFVFSTQEEVGLRGATTAAYAIDPDLGISVDVTLSGDTPKGVKMEVALGKGPAIKVRDGGMLADPRVVRLMVASAEKAGLPYQLEVLEGGTTDARAIQMARAGVPSGCVSIPCRYVHSPSEMVDYRDVQQSVQLLTALLSGPIALE